MTTPLERALVERIRVDGPISFADFMERALYDSRFGYYASESPRSGRNGDYVTSPELDPVFGRLWTRGFEQIWQAMGAPETFTVVEIGPGEGGFARAVAESVSGELAESISFVLVEPLPRLEARQRARLADVRLPISWVKSIEACGSIPTGVVFANEVLDNAPVHVVSCRGGELYEMVVGVSDDGRLASEWAPLAEERLRVHAQTRALTDGDVVEVAPQALDLVSSAASLLERGALILVDYGRGDSHRVTGTLTAYSRGTADVDILARPGERDVTAHVDWTTVRAACRGAGLATVAPVPQRRVLQRLGASELDVRLRAEYEDRISAGDGAAALRAMSRRHALHALADPAGLGGLEVVAAVRGVPVPDFVRE